MRKVNQRYPFGFTRDPITFSASLSLPIFNGLQREQRMQEAEANRNDARYNVRATELRLRADITSGYNNLFTAYQAVQIQTRNSEAAREALALAQERFRVGANTFVDLVQSRADYERDPFLEKSSKRRRGPERKRHRIVHELTLRASVLARRGEATLGELFNATLKPPP
jgi:hypothetical protein